MNPYIIRDELGCVVGKAWSARAADEVAARCAWHSRGRVTVCSPYGATWLQSDPTDPGEYVGCDRGVALELVRGLRRPER